jgi:hypothetical protein
MHSDGIPVAAEELARLDRLTDAAGGWLHWHAQEAVHDALADLADRATAAGGRHDRPATPDTPGGATAIVASSRLAVSELQLRPALARLAELVCQAVPGADAASIVLGPPADPQLLASSSTLAQTADGAQFAADGGPTFDAWSTRRPATADGGTEAFRARPGEPAVRSCLAVPLTAGASPAPIGVLTIYAESARALEPDATLPAVAPYVARAESLVVDGTRLTNLTRTLDQMHEALSSRAVIDQAKGVLMQSRGLSAEAAFQHLRSLSNTRNRKVRDLAEEIVATAATTEA